MDISNPTPSSPQPPAVPVPGGEPPSLKRKLDEIFTIFSDQLPSMNAQPEHGISSHVVTRSEMPNQLPVDADIQRLFASCLESVQETGQLPSLDAVETEPHQGPFNRLIDKFKDLKLKREHPPSCSQEEDDVTVDTNAPQRSAQDLSQEMPSESSVEDIIREAIEKIGLQSLNDLVNQGCDIARWKDAHGNTALHLAAEKGTGRGEILSFLLELGANPNAQNNVGNTPMHTAVENDYIYGGLLLRNYGGNPEISNYENLTPIDIAETKGIIRLDERGFLVGPSRYGDKISPFFEEWYKNQAFMLKFLRETAGVSEAAKEKLSLLILQAFSKTASQAWFYTQRLGQQASPLFIRSLCYHRSTRDNELIRSAENELMNGLFPLSDRPKWFDSKPYFFLVRSPLFREVLARTYCDDGKICTLSQIGEIDSLASKLRGMKRLTGKAPNTVLDFTNLVQEPADLERVVKIWEECKKEKDEVFSNAFPIVFMIVKGQDVIATFGYDMHSKLQSSLQVNGFVLPPDRTREVMLEHRDLGDILGQRGLGEVNVAIKGKKIPKTQLLIKLR